MFTCDVYIFFQEEELYCELNYHDQKIQRKLMHNIRKQWTITMTS